jgi:hypothetical protein
MEARGIQPDQRSFGALLIAKVLANPRQNDDAAALAQLQSRGLKPNVHFFNASAYRTSRGRSQLLLMLTAFYCAQ